MPKVHGTYLPGCWVLVLLTAVEEVWAGGLATCASSHSSAAGSPAACPVVTSDTGTALLQLQGRRLEASHGGSARRLPLVPYPAHVELGRNGSKPFVVSAATQVVLGANVSESELSVRILRDVIRAASKEAAKAGHSHAPGAAAGVITLELSPEVGHDEGYALRVKNDSVLLRARSAAGLLYAAQTFRQLVRAQGGALAAVPTVSIDDEPRFQWRGLHLDVSRHFFNATHVKSLLETMATYKLNRFHWHLTDDQGWRLPVPVLPELTRLGAKEATGKEEAYTEAEIRDVVAYAKERNIEVLPEVDVPGHAAAAIAAYPELGNTDISDWTPPDHPIWTNGVHEYTLAPSKRVLDFLHKVFGQLAELFPGKFVHIGGDEAPTGQWSRSRGAQSVLLGGTRQVQSYFNSKLAQMLAQWNRTCIGWDEVQHMGSLSPDFAIMAWRNAGEVMRAAAAGRRVVNANMESLYFDHYQGPEFQEPKAICCMTTLQEVYSYDPMPAGLTEAEQKLVMGVQGQLWSEYFPTWHQVEYMAFPRALALAERAWTSPKQLAGFGDFRRRLRARLPELRARGVAYRALDPERTY